jgi:hypothetical protein
LREGFGRQVLRGIDIAFTPYEERRHARRMLSIEQLCMSGDLASTEEPARPWCDLLHRQAIRQARPDAQVAVGRVPPPIAS